MIDRESVTVWPRAPHRRQRTPLDRRENRKHTRSGKRSAEAADRAERAEARAQLSHTVLKTERILSETLIDYRYMII
eukprot:5242004-Prymnesium_polylepis.1